MTERQPQGAIAPLLTPAERERAVERLSAAFAHDVLPMDELERRLAAVYRATSSAELTGLTADLPAPGAALASTSAELAPAPHRITATFANVERAGAIDIPPRLEIRSLFGNVELDLRDARFGVGVTELSIRAVFGNVELRLPAHVVVENHGAGVLASFACHVPPAHGPAAAGAPRVLITGRAILANVEVVVDAALGALTPPAAGSA